MKLHPISKEDLYGVWITYLMEFSGQRRPTDIRYYKYHFARDGQFYFSTHEGIAEIKERGKKQWSLNVKNTEEGESNNILINKEEVYKILRLEKDILVLEVIKSAMIYYLARAENYSQAIQQAITYEAFLKGSR